MKNNNFRILKKIVLAASAFSIFSCYPSYSKSSEGAVSYQKSPAEVEKVLQKLIRYEIDASFLSTQCMENLKDSSLRSMISDIKEKCENNVNDLTNLLKKYGNNIPEYGKDFKGYFMEGYAAMRGAFSDKGALEAFDTNLKLILKSYDSALKASLPQDVKDKLTGIYQQKRENLNALNRKIGEIS